MVKKNYRIKRTISIKQFISEFGETFSEHMKERLLELEVRCVLTRTEEIYRLDLKHVEHLQYDCNSAGSTKEYVFAQFVGVEDMLYFSDKSAETDKIMQSPIITSIYNSLSSDNMILDEGNIVKKVDDNNIDYVIDNILTVCPDVSKSYIAIMKDILSLERR